MADVSFYVEDESSHNRVLFKCKKDAFFCNVKLGYCQRQCLDPAILLFSFNGVKLNNADVLSAVGITDGSVVKVRFFPNDNEN